MGLAARVGLLALVAGAVTLALLPGGRVLGPRRSFAATRHPAVPVRAPHLSHRLALLERRGDATIRRLAALGRPIYCAGHRGHELALTFDDGPGVYTHLALRKLRRAGQRATFFVVGKSINSFPGYLPRELRVGALGDHTYTHPVLAVLSRAAVFAEIERDRVLIHRESGQWVDLFRPPYGVFNAAVLGVARRLHLLTIMWTQDSGDSLRNSYARITRNVEAALRPGAIILMHENRGQTIRALTALLAVLHRRRLTSVSLPELLATDPPSVAMVKRGQAACGRVQLSLMSG
jgi:peptidoglycan/xylan/chitin deacetylase (PgdA/CDA1 family)